MNNPTPSSWKPEKFHGKYRPQSNRLKGYDYASEGAYFITICCKDRESLFGEILDGKMVLNDLGKIAYQEWEKTEKIRKNIYVDEFVVMPNHVHGILVIDESEICRDTVHRVSTGPQIQQFGKPTKNSIPTIIRSYKATVTKQIHEKGFLLDQKIWQSNYYDRIVRSEDELYRIQEYIIRNPEKWDEDRNNTENIFI